MAIRSSRGLTPTYRQLIYACHDGECGATFGAELTITHGISPSAIPDPAISLRMSPPRIRRADNDSFPPKVTDGPGVPSRSPANDDAPEEHRAL